MYPVGQQSQWTSSPPRPQSPSQPQTTFETLSSQGAGGFHEVEGDANDGSTTPMITRAPQRADIDQGWQSSEIDRSEFASRDNCERDN